MSETPKPTPTLEQLQAAFEVTLEGTNILVACGEPESGTVVQERLRMLSGLRERILELKQQSPCES